MSGAIPAVRPGRAVLPLLALALLAMAAAVSVCGRGIGISHDSIYYLDTTRNLLAGRGFLAPELQYEASPSHLLTDRPMNHYPPLFPLLLAGISWTGVDPAEAARWLNILLLGATTLLIGFTVHRETGGSTAAAWIAAALAMCARPMFRAHTLALSEPTFLFFSILGLAHLAFYLEQRKPWMLGVAAAAVAIAWLARYVGVALVGTGLLGLLFLSRAPLRRRVIDCVVFLGIAALPTAAWLVWNQITCGSAAHRPLAWHPFTAGDLGMAAWTVSTWLAPEDLPRIARYLVLAVALPGAVALGVALARRGVRPPEPRDAVGPAIVPVMAVYLVIYLALVAVARSLFDAQIPFDTRNLLPAHAGLLILLAPPITALGRASGSRARRAILAVLFVVLGATVLGTARWAAEARASGQAYTGRSWVESEITRGIRALPPDVPIFTNDGFAVAFLTGRRPYGIPVRYDPMSNVANPEYASQMRELRDQLQARGSVLVFWRASGPTHLATEDEILRNMKLDVVLDRPEGCIYTARR